MLKDLIVSLHSDVYFGDMPQETAEFLQRKNVPSWLQVELERAYTLNPVTLGPFEFSAVSSVVQNNTGEPYGFFCDSGYLNLAYGPSGDHIAVELATGKMLFVNHDEFWEYYPVESGVTQPPDVRTRMINPNLDFQEFWQRATSELEFPCDAFEAEEIWPRYMVESDGTKP